MENPSMKVVYYLNAAANDVRRGVDGVFDGTAMSDLQWVILHEAHRANATVAEVAERVGRDLGAVSREVFNLESQGLVRVQQQDTPLSAIVTLTSRAEKQLPALTVAAEAVADRATSGLTNDEITSLISMLQRVVKNLG